MFLYRNASYATDAVELSDTSKMSRSNYSVEQSHSTWYASNPVKESVVICKQLARGNTFDVSIEIKKLPTK